MRVFGLAVMLACAGFAGCSSGDDSPAVKPTPPVANPAPGPTGTPTPTPTPGPSPGPAPTPSPGPTPSPPPPAAGDNKPPTANLTSDFQSGQAPLLVQFYLEGTDDDGDELTWTLDADGDGTPEGDQELGELPRDFDHSFTDVGTYTAKLTVSDGKANRTATLEITVVAAGQAPPYVEERSCHVDYGAVVLSGTTPVGNVGGCNLGDIAEGMTMAYRIDVPNGCSLSYDSTGDNIADGGINEGDELAVGANIFSNCDPGVVNVDTGIGLAPTGTLPAAS